MKIWSKFIVCFLVIAILAGMVGCSPKTSEPAAPAETTEQPAGAEPEQVTIRVLTMQQAGYPVEVVNEIAERFMADNPNVKVETEFVAYEALHDKITTAMATTPPAYDVVLVDDIWYAEFSNAGYLYDVSDKITDEMKQGIFPSGWEITTVDSKVYGLPWGIDGMYFFYNEKILKEAGFDNPPKTWEELEEMSQVIKDKGLVEYPMVWSWAQAEASICTLVALLFGNGGTFVDEAGNPAFNNTEGVEVVQWMVDSIDKGYTNPASISYLEEDVRNVFSQGKAVFAVNWGYMYQMANFEPEESIINGQVNMALMPVFKKGLEKGIETATINGSMGWSVANASPNKEIGWEFIKFMTSKPIQDEYSKYSTPAWQTSYEGENLEKLISYSEANKVLIPNYVKQIPFAHVRPKVPYYSEASLALQLALQQALTKQKTPQEALDEAAAKFTELQEKYQ
ncbi:MAG: sugar ABC transporter substrate-binding protein [Chloroflexi bacterium]|nr:sugar ABC transporter substrate-binding protein [Chloroflexota bacterium]